MQSFNSLANSCSQVRLGWMDVFLLRDTTVSLLQEVSEAENSALSHGRCCIVESWLVQIFIVDLLLRRLRARSTRHRSRNMPMATTAAVQVRMTTSRIFLSMAATYSGKCIPVKSSGYRKSSKVEPRKS